MKMRRVTALLLSVAMIATLAVGCGSKEEQTSKEPEKQQEENVDKDADADADADADKEAAGTLKLAAFEGGNGAEIWNKIAEAFEAETGATVELQISSELDQDLTKDIRNGDVPDVVYYNLGQPSGFTETMLKENLVADITDVFDAELKDRLIDGITEGSDAQPYGDGKIYLAPFTYTPCGFWYDASLVGEGKTYELPTTWDEFFAVGDQAKANGSALFTYPTNGYFDAVIYQMLAQAGGLEFYEKAVEYDANTWTSEEGKKVLDTIAKLVSADYIQADTVANANSDGGFKINQQNVIDGKALFMPNGNWVIGEMANSTPEGFEWGMMAPPKFAGDTTNALYTFTEQIWIPADAENMDLAKEFIKFMYSDTVVELMLDNKVTNKETGEVSDSPIVAPVKGVADKLPEGAVKSTYIAAQSEGIVAVTGKWATTQPIEGLDLNKVIYGAIDSVSTGDMTVEEWQTQLTEAWATCLENK